MLEQCFCCSLPVCKEGCSHLCTYRKSSTSFVHHGSKHSHLQLDRAPLAWKYPLLLEEMQLGLQQAVVELSDHLASFPQVLMAE